MGKKLSNAQIARRVSVRLRIVALLMLALTACSGIAAQPQVGGALHPTRDGGDQTGGSGGGGSGGM